MGIQFKFYRFCIKFFSLSSILSIASRYQELEAETVANQLKALDDQTSTAETGTNEDNKSNPTKGPTVEEKSENSVMAAALSSGEKKFCVTSCYCCAYSPCNDGSVYFQVPTTVSSV